MANLRIERVPIKVFGLGLIGGDHMHLALQQADFEPRIVQDTWYVMEGSRDPGPSGPMLGVIGADGTTTLSEANGGLEGEDLVAEMGTPWTRGSRYLAQGAAANEAWDIMQGVAEDLAGVELPYYAVKLPWGPIPTINSTSMVGSLLYYAGIDLADNMPYGIRFSPGWDTLIGTSSGDEFIIANSLQNILGGEGNDTLSSADNSGQLDRLYGGYGDDQLTWSTGDNIFHGGQPRVAYVKDGIDTVGYIGVGSLTINAGFRPIEGLRPDFVVTTPFGRDELYSIERVVTDDATDTVRIGPGVEYRDDLLFDLRGQQSEAEGDTVDFSEAGQGLLMNADSNGRLAVRLDGEHPELGTLWFEGAEWVVASAGADRIYATPDLRGIDAGGGDDVIDVRLDAAFAGGSPGGYDIEISGGEGADTIVSSGGRTLVEGGAGADRFVLSATSPGAGQMVELVIADAEAADRVYIPYDMFNDTFGDFEGSALMALRGAIGQVPGHATFADLPENLGPWISTIGQARSDYFRFVWQTNDQTIFNDDETSGAIDFAGQVFYNREGTDLLIHVFTGTGFDVVDTGVNGLPWPHRINAVFLDTETIIRVKDFQDGDLGITFYDVGEPEAVEVTTSQGQVTAQVYPGLDAAVAALTGDFIAPLDTRPAAPVYDPQKNETGGASTSTLIGTAGDDTLSPAGDQPNRVDAGSGNDTVVTGGGSDEIDGGTGADSMTGGSGNDIYYADNAGDSVIEAASGGTDEVITSASMTLADNVENARLAHGELSVSGNALDNVIAGSDGNDIIAGAGGSDDLIGSLGNDHLDGGAGSDRFFYSRGDGDDNIADSGAISDTDTLFLTQIALADLTFHRASSAPDDLLLLVSGGGSIVLTGLLSAPGAGIDALVFEDTGLTLTRAQIDALAAATPVLANAAPRAFDDPDLMVLGNDITIDAATFLANDSDSDGDALSIVTAASETAGATVELTLDGKVRIVTAAGFSGPVALTYQISDSHGGLATAHAEVGVLPNSAPVSTGPIADQTTAPGTPWAFVIPDNQFTDADNDMIYLRATLAGGAALPAWLSFDAAAGVLQGTPPSGTSGRIDIALTATDGVDATELVFGLVIQGSNTPPVALGDTVPEMIAGTTRVILAADLLANDSDGNGDALIIATVGDAIGGTVLLDGSGNAVFTADSGYDGVASFTYGISDGNGGTASASVSIAVYTPATPPGQTFLGTPGNDALDGTAFGDRIIGLAGDDILRGFGGDDVFVVRGQATGFDVFRGGAGIDRIEGGAGNDVIGIADVAAHLTGIEVIDGGGGFDVIRLSSASGAADGDDTLNLSSVTLIGIERIVAGSGDDVVIGSAGIDRISGGSGQDRLSGGGGNDRLIGGAGADVLTGGDGRDAFVFRGEFGRDRITDFDAIGAGRDVLVIDSLVAASYAEVMSHASAVGADVLIEFDANTAIRLTGVTLASLTADDFRFV